MKAILVTDMPKCCSKCKFWFAKATEPVQYRCMAAQKYIEALGSKPDWCPLRELPEHDLECHFPDELEDGYAAGWNDCLNKIAGNS